MVWQHGQGLHMSKTDEGAAVKEKWTQADNSKKLQLITYHTHTHTHGHTDTMSSFQHKGNSHGKQLMSNTKQTQLHSWSIFVT